jgi:hypothetical protein
MDIRRMLAGASVIAVALMTVSPASAKGNPHGSNGPTTSDKVVGTVKIDGSDPSVAYVLAQYTCTIADPENHPGHLWVSVKQNDAGTVDAAVSGDGSGFGGIATRWSDSHRNDIRCDGKNHVERFTVDQLEPKGATYKALIKGDAWVQFCLFDDTTPEEPVSSMVWAHVR